MSFFLKDGKTFATMFIRQEKTKQQMIQNHQLNQLLQNTLLKNPTYKAESGLENKGDTETENQDGWLVVPRVGIIGPHL